MLTALGPQLYFLLISFAFGDDGIRSYIWESWGSCLGRDIYDPIESWTFAVADFPLFQYGGAPLIVLGFAGWYLSVRRGRETLGRVLGRVIAVVLLVLSLPGPLLIGLDSALGPQCAEAWGPADLVSDRMWWGLYSLVSPVLVLLAVRPPRREFVRRSTVALTAAAILVVATLLLLPTRSAAPSKVSSEQELDCVGFGGGTVTGLSADEKRFLCQVRGYDLPDGSSYGTEGLEGWDEVSDEDVLAQGRQLCDVATRHGGDIQAPAVQQAPQVSLAGALTSLCPAVARAQEAEGRRRQEEADAYVAEKEKACAAHPRHRPRIHPVRQRRATMWTEFWTIDGWDEGFEGTVPDLVKDLVGSERGALRIWAADEIGHACVTAESYTRRPPLEAKAWEEIVEVGYESPTGSLYLVDGDGKQLPGLASRGPGSYRVRVHLRGRKLVYQVAYPPDGAVELLIEVFPGKEKKPVVYK